MSATDSDNSIDWLASDNEEIESEQESDCPGKRSPAEASSPSPGGPPARLGLSAQLKEADASWREVGELSGPGAPGCAERRGRGGAAAAGLCKAQHGDKAIGKSGQQALKRPHGSTEEERRERQLGAAERDRLFSRKCLQLQCYIHPLSSILNGLRSGRYRERLSSFQESVAMDRIQRIMGVLQNPYMGGRYINIILKMEEMLKSWFPNVKVPEQPDVTHTEEATPTKKAKLSPGTPAAAATPVTVSDPPAGGVKALRVTDLTPPAAYSASNLKWLHTSPICSLTAEQAQAGPRHLLTPRDRDLTQDSAVSSSTDSGIKTDSAPRGPPPGKINAPCLERLLKSTDSIITRRGSGALMDSSWS